MPVTSAIRQRFQKVKEASTDATTSPPPPSIHLNLMSVLRNLHAQFEEKMEYKLTMQQYEVLLVVSSWQIAGPVSQQEVTRKTGIDRASVSSMCALLDSKGVLRRKRKTNNLRTYEVSLTDFGIVLVEQGRAVSEELYRKLYELPGSPNAVLWLFRAAQNDLTTE
jgi:DNA-binding MarR family transcriptional regulator